MKLSPISPLLFTKYDKLAKPKVCSNCVHFTQNYNDVAEYGCKKYSQQHIVTGKMLYEALPGCRESPEKCTVDGKDFKEFKFAYLRNLKLKVYAHFWNDRYRYLMFFNISKLLFCLIGSGTIAIKVVSLILTK